jgi:hypothetical protein
MSVVPDEQQGLLKSSVANYITKAHTQRFLFYGQSVHDNRNVLLNILAKLLKIIIYSVKSKKNANHEMVP